MKIVLHIKHISLISAFKVGCLMSAAYIIIAAIGLCSMLTGLIPQHYYTPANIVNLLPAVVLIGLAWGIVPGLVLAFHALIYNIIAHFFGGFMITTERIRAMQASQATKKTATAPVAGPSYFASDDMPAPSSHVGRYEMHDEVAELNRQIKERQKRIAEINQQINRTPK